MTYKENTNDSAAFLPVGMIANAGTYGQAIEMAAVRKHSADANADAGSGSAGWAPFHYEKISDTEYVCTGGYAIGSGGYKKWPEPHTTVVVSISEIEHALSLLLEDAQDKEDVVAEMKAPGSFASSQSAKVSSPQLSSPSEPTTQPKYLTVVLQLPNDKEGQQRIKDAFKIDELFFGALVTSISTRAPN